MNRRVVAACCGPQVLIALDFALMSVAVPGIRDDLSLSPATTRWVFSAYTLAFGATLLAGGRLADALGAERVLRAGLALFGLGCAAAATAPTGAVLIAGRALQGLGAACMTPAALAVLTRRFPEGGGREAALAAYGIAVSVGFTAGALAAGVLATAGSWRAVLGLDLAAAACSGALAAALGRPPRAETARGAPFRGLRTRPTGETARGVALGGLLSAPRAVLGRRRGAGGCAAGALVTGTGAGATLLLALHLHEERGYSPLAVGLAFAVFGAVAPLGARAIRSVARRARPGLTAAAGLGLQGAVLLALAALAASGSGALLLAGMAGFGVAQVMGNVGVTIAVMGGVPAAHHGGAGATLSTAQYLGGTIGPLLLGATGSFGRGMALGGALALAGSAAVWLALRGG